MQPVLLGEKHLHLGNRTERVGFLHDVEGPQLDRRVRSIGRGHRQKARAWLQRCRGACGIDGCDHEARTLGGGHDLHAQPRLSQGEGRDQSGPNQGSQPKYEKWAKRKPGHKLHGPNGRENHPLSILS